MYVTHETVRNVQSVFCGLWHSMTHRCDISKFRSSGKRTMWVNVCCG